MAIITIALTNRLNTELGSVPGTLATALGPLLAGQRDNYVNAWLNAPADQQQRAADQWVVPEEERAAFERVRVALTGEDGVAAAAGSGSSGGAGAAS